MLCNVYAAKTEAAACKSEGYKMNSRPLASTLSVAAFLDARSIMPASAIAQVILAGDVVHINSYDNLYLWAEEASL
jgi:hypothetical protein